MINAIIVDDVEKSIILLRTMLQRHCPEINVVAEAQRINEGIRLIESHKPQLVFLDVEMSEGSGFDLLERIRERNFHVIFVTAHDEFALKAFRFSVTHYLLKPVNKDLLKQAIQKVKALVQVSASTMQTLRIPTVEGGVYIYIINIVRLEAEGPYTHIYMDDGKHYMTSHHLKQFESALSAIDSTYFIRIHRSHLVNRHKITAFSNKGIVLTVEMSDSKMIEVSRRNKQEMIKILKLKMD